MPEPDTTPAAADIAADLIARCPEHGTSTEAWPECRCAAAREAAAWLAANPEPKPPSGLRGQYAAAIDAVTGGTCPTDIIDAVLAVRDQEMQALRAQQERYEEEIVGRFNQQAIDLTRRTESAESVLGEVLAQFTQQGHPGAPCLRTPWIRTPTVERWRAALTPPAPGDHGGEGQ